MTNIFFSELSSSVSLNDDAIEISTSGYARSETINWVKYNIIFTTQNCVISTFISPIVFL